MPRNRVIVFCIFALSIILTSLLSTALARANAHDRVEIRSDQAAGTAQILIDGKSIMTVDSKGVHIQGDLEYTGVVADTGGGGHD